MKACSWQELEQLAHTYSADFNYVQVSALVCRLPKVVPEPSRLPQPEKSRFSRFLREISDLVTERLSTFDPRAIANVLWAVSKLGFSPAPPVLNKFLFEAYVRMYDFNAQELANLAWALAVLSDLGNRPVPVWLHKFTDAAMPRAPELKPMELAHLMWGLSKLFPPGAASQAATSLLQQPDIVSTTASGTESNRSSARSTPAGAAVQGQPNSALSSPGASNAPTDCPSTSAGASADPNGAATPGPAGCSVSVAALPDLAAALTVHAITLIPHFSSGELVMSIVSLHTLDASAGFHLLRHALPRILSAEPGDMSPHDVCTVWLVLGKCATDSTLGPGLLPPVRSGDSGRHASSGITGAPSQIIGIGGGGSSSKPVDARTGVSLGTASARTLLKTPPPPPLVTREQLRTLLDVVTPPVIQGSTAQGLCLLLWGWARLRLRPSDAVTEAVFQRFREVLPAQATFQCVAISLWAAAQLGLRPPAAAMALFEACARLLLPASKPGERMALLWALQAMRYRPGRALLKALNCRLQAAGDQLQPAEVQQVLSAYDVFGECAPVQVRVRALEVASQVATAVKGEARAAGDDAVSMGLARQQGTLRPLQPLTWTPCAAVRYFATLVGLGVDTAADGSRRLAVERKLETLRWRLYHSRTRKLGLRDSIEDTVRGRLPELKNGSLCLLLAVMVRLRLKPRPAFIQEVYGEITARSRSGSIPFWVAGSLLGSLGRLRPHLRPSQELLTSLLFMMEPHLRSLTDGHLLTLVQSLARLRYRPPLPWLRSYFAECMARVDGLSTAQLGVLMSSMVALGLRLRGTPCLKLQAVVYRRKRRTHMTEAGADLGVAAPSPVVKAQSKGKKAAQSKGKAAKGVAAAAREVDLKRTLCALCTELSGCAI